MIFKPKRLPYITGGFSKQKECQTYLRAVQVNSIFWFKWIIRYVFSNSDSVYSSIKVSKSKKVGKQNFIIMRKISLI